MTMKINDEILAAYTEGKLSPKERKSVFEHLVEHPLEMEAMMVMMDEDYDLSLDEELFDDKCLDQCICMSCLPEEILSMNPMAQHPVSEHRSSSSFEALDALWDELEG